MATNECIFCGGSPTTNEDILSNWIVELIADFGKQSGAAGSRRIRRRDAPDGTTQELNEWKGGFKSRLLAKCVCQPCNNGWMSDIDNAVKKPLTEMIFGRPVALDLVDQENIAKYLGLKAVVENFSRPEQSPLINEWISAFYADRKPPDGWHIRIGYYDGQMAWMAGGSSIDTIVSHALVPFPFKMPGFVFTFTIGRFLGQVIGIGRQGNVPIDPSCFIQVWPHPLKRVNPLLRAGAYDDAESWPPERGLSHAQVTELNRKPLEPI